ncbi:DUF6265 family protein [Myxococcota bacterium]|nr:DUF6265 family protein [Myxococcota bacterium]
MSLAALSWMLGSWVLVEGERASYETWRLEDERTLVGAARSEQDGRVTSWEHLRIVQQGEGPAGLVVYLASPGGRFPTAFALVEQQEQRVAFENPGHDFPRRITYWRQGEQLCVELQGQEAGGAQELSWCWQREAPPRAAD